MPWSNQRLPILERRSRPSVEFRMRRDFTPFWGGGEVFMLGFSVTAGGDGDSYYPVPTSSSSLLGARDLRVGLTMLSADGLVRTPWRSFTLP